MQANPIRQIGSWAELSPEQRRRAVCITADAFRKRTAVARADERALRRMSDSIIAFTQQEGFPAHEAAVRIRLGNLA